MRTYEKYKDSGISWIGKVPEDWEVMKIKHICKLYSGATPTTSNPQFWNGDIKWVTPVDINEKFILETARKITREGYESCGTNMVESNSIIMSTRAPIGKVAINKVPVCTNQGCKSIVCNQINVGYCYYLLSTCTEELKFLGSGTTFLELSFSALANFEIPYPSTSEQQAIANYLDKKTAEIDKIIAEREKKIELLNELKSSIISRAVTKGINPHAKMKDSGIDWIGKIPEDWEVGRFKYSFKVRKGLTITKADLVDEGIPVISYGQVHSKDNPGTSLKESLLRYVPNKYLYSDKDSLVCKGDFIFADTSEDIEGCGNCVYVDRNMELFAGYHSIIAKSIHSDDCKFFSYLFLTDSWRKQIRTRVSGVKVFSITQDYLKNTTLIIPPYSEQKAIVDFLDKKTLEIDSTIATIKKECILYKEYKQSLISEVVTGKRKVID